MASHMYKTCDKPDPKSGLAHGIASIKYQILKITNEIPKEKYIFKLSNKNKNKKQEFKNSQLIQTPIEAV